ncbi:uncharacterized protein LOC125097357 [Lutra lutra]|uniref:uncharacterized protein LOC125097357 n=1 Tax=Lutra lutra TaxID=9657 RepID=UPI001FD3551D|nr:uncharacterized protein LOC125097357 [Lutra lutra]
MAEDARQGRAAWTTVWIVADLGLVQKWAVELPQERAQRRHSNCYVGGARKAATDWSGKPGILSAASKERLSRPPPSPHPRAIPRPRSGARPPATRIRTRRLPALPRAQPLSRPPPTQPRALGARVGGGCAAPVEAAPGTWMSSQRMLRRGARRPPQSTRARIPQKFGSGSVGSEMQPKPHFTEPCANKTRTSTHTDAAAARRGRVRHPGGAAVRDRPLKGG